VPENVSDEAACLIEPAACALESIFATPHPVGVDAEGRHLYRAGIRKDGLTCIIGSGTLSLIYAALAHLEGAREVHMIVRSPEKAELALGILGPWIHAYVTPRLHEKTTAGQLAAEKKIVEEMRAITDGRLFDDVVAACADPAAQRLMMQLYSPEGYAVGACFGGTHETVDCADMDVHHYRCAKTVGTSGCSTDAMKTVLAWVAAGRLSLNGFTDARHWTFRDEPGEFLQVSGSLKPSLYPWAS
jgi:threonine dehydrogenase-like Zn-dependent dehydrogenase